MHIAVTESLSQFRLAREALIAEHLSGLSGADFVRRYALWGEGVVRFLFEATIKARPELEGRVSLLALGGFGRGELNLHSDFDLLFLIPSKNGSQVEELAQKILYPLWDLGLEVGHATRTLEECLKIAESDFTALMAMLTARAVAGPEEPAGDLAGRLRRSLNSDRARRAFLDRVRRYDLDRQVRFGHTPYLLEPHLKEGEGGLRDIHIITWVGLGCFGYGQLFDLADQGLLTPGEVSALSDTRDFLWRIRNHLHYLAKSRDDRLTFERQEQVAAFLEWRAKDGLNRVERFMRVYYRRAFGLRNIRDLFFERAEARLAKAARRSGRLVQDDFLVRDQNLVLADPARLDQEHRLLMRLFAVAARMGLNVAHQAREEVRRRLHLVNGDFRQDPAVAADFLAVLTAPTPGAETLFALHGSDLLVAYLPELEGVFQLPQHDAYHIYTVDVHQLRTIDSLNRLRLDEPEAGSAGSKLDETLARRLMREISPDKLSRLYLAALFHDVGKSKGRDHAAAGAEMVGPALKRLGLGQEDADLVRFLIGQHLLLNVTASRRDIHDEKMLLSVASQAQTEERLNLLYLLTVADSLATGPKGWSSWLSSLVKELYLKTLAILARKDIGALRSPEEMADLKAQVLKLVAGVVPAEGAGKILDSYADQYLLSTGPETLAQHVRLEAGLSGRKLALEIEEKPDAGYVQVTLATRRRRGLFSRMAGVLTLNGLNILGAQVYTRESEVSIESFQCEIPPDEYGRQAKWARIETDMNRVLTGRLALSVRIDQRRRQARRPSRVIPRRAVEVQAANDISDFQTVVEVAAHDRMGLLYDITRVLYELDLDIHVAKISTKIDQVMDVFYITDSDGAKVEDQEKLTEIIEGIKAALVIYDQPS